MKRLITAKTQLKQGSYVVDRKGRIYDIGMHVPSTTYLSRGIYHLALTDADFLLNQGLIDEDDATAIVLYCYNRYNPLADLSCLFNSFNNIVYEFKLGWGNDQR